ncbi:DNA polymerase III subunit delta' C-terminal domain-containing protein [Francisella adeliensis]|uniref:DNA polymerase III subunit delta n=1 Tax=Francisella adeliensis TaxID=2007306 RepID=A0A2Z4XZW0_9GAMM|nr:DNA polymerase III subunit delta' C-terminal domain-containing protein [Francisella adeliensis]AXA34249.1 DNA polymerase III subunit delta' [Francisella adeliensis]MBK2084890.1 DNA polymerase III subunit delta' [Francisella adeliensis]MBK2096279.1 DNA polymerase III subunit delta' [Francisella adeliensis]QIW12493.1 DNA polymerase III subunit delta' [Francisella adeliensis]QIW14366.1 DNA polymerase III subunit delta' [Francisella adeliensis]
MLSLNTHKNLLDNFQAQKNSNKLHHAFIFKVKDAVLLDSFIKSFCEILLGQEIQDYEDSPYVTIAKVENDEIKVAEIKRIIKSCELTAHNDLAKIIIIPELSFLNDSATNALLKTLEEPTENTFFLSFTRNFSDILDTVKSRSLTYDIAFDDEDKYNYLEYTFEMSKEAVAKSLQMSRDDINVIAKIKLEPEYWKIRASMMKVLVGQVNVNVFLKEVNPHFKDTLYWLTSLIIDVYNYNLDPETQYIANYDKLAVIKYLATKLHTNDIYKIYQQTLEAKNYFANYKNVDKELVLENIILEILK